MAKRTPAPASKPQPSLPHDYEREGGQPYAKEVEDYKHGVASAPEEQVAKEAIARAKNLRRGTEPRDFRLTPDPSPTFAPSAIISPTRRDSAKLSGSLVVREGKKRG